MPASCRASSIEKKRSSGPTGTSPRLADVRDRRTGVVRHARDDLSGRLKDPDKVLLQLGRLKERYRKAWGYVKISFEDLRLSWRWDRHALRLAASRDGAYLFALTWTVAIRPNFGPNTSSLPKSKPFSARSKVTWPSPRSGLVPKFDLPMLAAAF
jgi:hypothetical protein